MMLAILICAVFFIQTPQTSQTGTIEGVVTKVGTGEPVGGATVALAPHAGGAVRNTATDKAGRFFVSDLEPGEYTVNVTASPLPGATTAGFITLTLAPRQHVTDVRLQLVPSSAISGRIYDVDGKPASLISVEALSYRVVDGQRLLEKETSSAANQSGEYQLTALKPGEYYLRALPTVKGALDRRYFAPVYYPGVTDPQLASPVRLDPGTEINSINFSLTYRDTYTVRVRIDNGLVNPFNRFPRFSVAPRSRNLTEEAATRFISVGGNTYEAAGFLPGLYDIFASVMPEPTDPVQIGHVAVQVTNQDVHAGTLQIRPGIPIRGQISLDESAKTDLTLSNIQIMLRPLDQMPIMYSPRAQPIAQNGSFTFRSVPRGRFQLFVAGLPADVRVASARYGGHDILDRGFVVGGGRQGEIEIQLRDKH